MTEVLEKDWGFRNVDESPQKSHRSLTKAGTSLFPYARTARAWGVVLFSLMATSRSKLAKAIRKFGTARRLIQPRMRMSLLCFPEGKTPPVLPDGAVFVSNSL